MKDAALIACDNGLGHVRRCYLIGLELAKRGWEVDLFAPASKFTKFARLFETHSLLGNVDFSTTTSVELLKQGADETLYWHRRLPDLTSYGLVLSDNLPEVLSLRPDTVLSGHFFWHDVLSKLPKEYVTWCHELVAAYEPPVIATELFASHAVRASARYIPVGLYARGAPSRQAMEGNALLVTGGTTSATRNVLRTIVRELAAQGPLGFDTVFVDRELIPEQATGPHSQPGTSRGQSSPPWMKPATYDDTMYARTNCAICRPGIGTVTDLLQRGGRPLCVYEPENQEVRENAKRLEAAGVAEDLAEGAGAVKAAERYLGETSRRQKHAQACGRLSFLGASEAVEVLERVQRRSYFG